MTDDEVTAVALEVMGDNGLLKDGWAFEFRDSMEGKTSGHCHWSMKTIRLSRKYTSSARASPHRVRELMQHEVAHAFTPEDLEHGEKFQAKFREIRSGA
jgi:predicted SprT family Zn-dependent metalloprotease